jgi:hypothetical protein
MAKTHVWVGGWVGGGGGVRGRGEEVPLCLITSLPEKKKKVCVPQNQVYGTRMHRVVMCVCAHVCALDVCV